MKLYSPATIAAIKDKYGFRFTKSLGQNFLIDQNVIEKILDESLIEKEDLVIEIGPGIGVLTAAVAQRAGKVIAVEIDKNLIPILRETLKDYENIEILHQDILKTDLGEIIRKNEQINGERTRAVSIIGNLPYYITTPILMKILEERVPASRITVMLQKEVADRMKAGPGTKAYGALSVAVQYYAAVTHVATVPRDVFIPKPNVDSTVVRLDIRKERLVDLIDENVFFECVKKGFGQRRKTLLNSLTGICGLDKNEVLLALNSAGIDAGRRAETLNLNEFALLANQIKGVN